MRSEFDDQILPDRKALLGQALDQLRAALELLDDAHAPGEVGAHVDLAACKLEGILEQMGRGLA